MKGSFMHPIGSIFLFDLGGMNEGGFTSKNYSIETKKSI
jgi:hypothetical protein